MKRNDLWRVLLVLAAVCLGAGGHLHPAFDTSLPTFDAIVASPMYASSWVPVHALILVGLALLLAGLVGLARSGVLSPASRWPARVAIVGAALSVLEMAFHLAAVADRDALAAGAWAPIASIHQALQVPSHPLLGFAVAAIALIEISRLGWAWRVVSVVGLLGALAHGLAGPVVLLSRNAALGPLFLGAGPMAVYLAAVALAAARLRASPSGSSPRSAACSA